MTASDKRKPLLILKLVIVIILSFVLTSIIYETIEYFSIVSGLFSGDKFGQTPKEFYKMRILTMVCYCGLVVYPAYQLSILFFHVFIGYKAGKIVYLYQIIFSVLLASAYIKGTINELSIYIASGNFLDVHCGIVFCYFSLGFILISLLLPASKLRRSIKVQYCRRIQRNTN